MPSAYLAHNFAARFWLLTKVFPKFLEAEIVVTSTWITVLKEHDITLEALKKHALQDINDILAADYFIYFADQFGPIPGRGKFVELGFALNSGVGNIIVVTEDIEARAKECAFLALALPTVKTVDEAIGLIKKRQENER